MVQDSRQAAEDAAARRLLAVLGRRWRWVACPMVAMAILGFVLASLKPPEYTAETTLATAGDSGLGALGAAAASFGIIAGGGAPIEMHKELLKSEKIVTEALAALDIEMDWKELTKFRLRSVRTSAGTGTNVLTLKVTRRDPEQAAAIANTMVELYLQQQTDLRRTKTERASSDIREEMDAVVARMESTESETRDYKTRAGITDLVAETAGAVDLAKSVEARLRESEGRAAGYESEARRLRAELSNLAKVSISATTVETNPVVEELEAKIAGLEVDRAGLAAVEGPKSPATLQIEQQLATAKTELEAAVKRVVTAQVEAPDQLYLRAAQALAEAEASAISSRAEAAALSRTLSTITGRLRDVPYHERELTRFLRRETVDAQLYGALVQQYYQAKLMAETTAPGIDLIARAHPPERPESRKRVTNAIAFMFLGLILGAGLMLLAEKRDPTVRRDWDLDAEYGAPILATLPVRGSRGPAAEPFSAAYRDQLRPLARKLVPTEPSAPCTVVLVCGATPGEGVSRLAGSLAAVLAERGVRTLLVDADLRSPSLHVAFGVAVEPGLREVLQGGGASVFGVQRLPGGLELLPSGGTVADPPALLDGAALGKLVEAVRGAYRAVVLDCPPAAGAVDYALLAGHADVALLVVRPRRTNDRVLREMLWEFSSLESLSVGLAVTDESRSV